MAGFTTHASVMCVKEALESLTHCGMLLLLGKHVLLGLQMRHGMRIGSSHARLHAHHRPRLADWTIGTRHAWVHAGMHLLAWIWPAWTSHARMAVGHALWRHAWVVWVARGHHIGCSSARAVASQWNDAGCRDVCCRRRCKQRQGAGATAESTERQECRGRASVRNACVL